MLNDLVRDVSSFLQGVFYIRKYCDLFGGPRLSRNSIVCLGLK